MCRWLAYTGNPIPLETVLFRARHSLIDQSLHSRMGRTTTNGDGFGVGWYGHPTDIPFRYRCAQPAWSDFIRKIRASGQSATTHFWYCLNRSSTCPDGGRKFRKVRRSSLKTG
jgi:predicted glutamine amidotransferase